MGARGAALARLGVAVAVLAAASLAWLHPWTRPPVPPAEIKSVQVLSATTAVVLTDDRLAYETRDAGASWRSFAVVADSEVRFVDPLHGFQTTEDRLLATADGGRSWQPRQLPPGQHYAPAAWFLDAQHGWYLNLNYLPGTGLPRTLYRTFDGGRSWQWTWSGTSGTAQVPLFADPEHGWMAADLSVLATADGGQTWQKVPAPLLGARAGVRLAGPALVEYSSRLSSAGEVVWEAATSADGGASWSPPVLAPPTGIIDLEFADARHWRAISRAQVWRTDDAGLSWQPLTPRLPAGDWLDSTSYLDADRGWALAGTQPSAFPTRLLRTADGGGSWTEVALPQLG
ncbi:MAG TPA: hypothetical protein VF160_09715 [Candidatus Dormibacteraeota bacterium]